MRVGGREFSQTRRDIEQAMSGEHPDPVQKYVVEVNGTAYPPKQVLARATGWDRQSFTTMEAQRVLRKLNLMCREADTPSALMEDDDIPERDRITVLEAAVATAQEAIAGLAVRVRHLESASPTDLQQAN